MFEWPFSIPWYVPAFVVAAGIAVWVSGNRRTDSRTRRIGIGIALLGVLLGAVSYLVVTDVEKCSRQSKELVKAVVDQDWQKMRAMLDPHVRLQVLNFGTKYDSRDALLEGAQAATQQYGLHSASTTVADAVKQGGLITTTVDVMASTDVTAGRPFPTTWQFDWERSDAGWTLREIRAIKIGLQNAADAQSLFPRGH